MKIATIGIALLALVALPALPTGAVAHACDTSCGHHVRWADHHSVGGARVAITSVDGNVTLLLTDRVVAFQLSDRKVHQVERALKDKKDEQDNWLGSVIVTAVVGTVRQFIDNSFECRVRDLRDVTYENGQLSFIARDGRHVFEDADIDGSDLSTIFSERDARRFVREFQGVKGGQL